MFDGQGLIGTHILNRVIFTRLGPRSKFIRYIVGAAGSLYSSDLVRSLKFLA